MIKFETYMTQPNKTVKRVVVTAENIVSARKALEKQYGKDSVIYKIRAI